MVIAELQCVANAFYRTDNGKGKPLCNKCSLQSAQDNVASMKSWLTKRLVKLIASGVFVLIGLVLGLMSFGTNGILGFILFAIIPWAIAGFIIGLGIQKPQKSFSDELYEYEHPTSSNIIKIIMSAIVAPIFLVMSFTGYYKTYSDYKQELSNLATMQNTLA